MKPEKVGAFIKELRKKNNLTQKDLAKKYNVTYQAVSKWENGINLHEISLIRQMSKDFNIDVEDILDGKMRKEKNKYRIISLILLVIFLVIALIAFSNMSIVDDSFAFKTISTTCREFKVSGSIAYNNKKSSIYISHIDYCGGDDNTVYESIKCELFESNKDTIKLISSCKKEGKNINLEDYLKKTEINIDNYIQACKKYNNDSLFLEINATKNNKTIKYKIPLSLNENCPK